MTRFEKLMQKKESALNKARKTNDERVRDFYVNAAAGFFSKIEKMQIAEAEAAAE